MDFITSWLIQRMEWVYGFVVRDLHLPSRVGYAVIVLLIALFFYDLVDLYRNRNKGDEAVVWLIVLFLVPLGTIFYIVIGRWRLTKLSNIVPQPPQPAQPTPTAQSFDPTKSYEQQNYDYSSNAKTATTMLGSVIGGIALVAGSIAVFFFIMVGIALVQCSNDPKCM